MDSLLNESKSVVDTFKSIGGSIDSGAKSIADKFTNKDKFTDLRNFFAGDTGVKVNVNNNTVGVEDKVIDLTKSFNNAITNIDKSIDIKKYTTPTTLTLNAFDKMGKDIDEALKDSFLLQTLKLKGTDILCSTFCFLLSMLSCSDRNMLYQSIQKASKTTQMFNRTVNAANEMIKATGAAMASTDDIAKSAKALFAKDGTANKKDFQETLAGAAVFVAAPITIINNATMIINALKVGLQYKSILPNSLGKAVWDLGAIIMMQVQMQVLQAADEALNNLFNPIEEKINKTIKLPCTSTMSKRLQTSIIDAIEKFKQFLLGLVADLFTCNKNNMDSMKGKTKESALALELVAFSLALQQLTAKFFDIAKMCGVAPCNDNGGDLNNIPNTDFGNHESIEPFDNTSSLPKYNSGKFNIDPLKADNITDLAQLISDKGANNIFVTPTEILAVNSIDNIPKTIMKLIEDGVLNSALDNNYELYKDKNKVNIVYKYKRSCIEE